MTTPAPILHSDRLARAGSARMSCRPRPARSVREEGVLVVRLEMLGLVLLAQDAIADDEAVDLRPHEAAERVLRGADDRLAAHVEAGVDQDRAARLRLERAEQIPVAWIGVAVDGLDPSRIVDMGDRRDVGPDHVEPVDAEQPGVFAV